MNLKVFSNLSKLILLLFAINHQNYRVRWLEMLGECIRHSAKFPKKNKHRRVSSVKMVDQIHSCTIGTPHSLTLKLFYYPVPKVQFAIPAMRRGKFFWTW
eukprot:Pompholyxophrys_punicea_v1_NODE_395_length_2063_cov_5.624004.p3 type:complete len:100 gc:universal NODE_395_length_2063_cov_5.624004:1467-1168(-)